MYIYQNIFLIPVKVGCFISKSHPYFSQFVNDLVQDCDHSSALAVELLQSPAKPLIYL